MIGFLTVLFSILVFSHSFTEAQELNKNLINQDGTIAKEFWKTNLSKKAIPDPSFQFIHLDNLATLIDNAQADSSSNDAKELVRDGFFGVGSGHSKKGALIKITDESVGLIESMDALDENFSVCKKSLIIDPNNGGPRISSVSIIKTTPPVTACEIWESGIGGSAGITVQAVNKADDGSFLFFVKGFPTNGSHASEPFLQVYDINFDKKTCSQREGTYCEDLDKNGTKELITGYELAPFLYWYVIFSYQNGTWEDVSYKYPDFYKNQAVSNYSTYDGPSNYEYIKKAFTDAAKAGGPSAFIQQTKP